MHLPSQEVRQTKLGESLWCTVLLFTWYCCNSRMFRKNFCIEVYWEMQLFKFWRPVIMTWAVRICPTTTVKDFCFIPWVEKGKTFEALCCEIWEFGGKQTLRRCSTVWKYGRNCHLCKVPLPVLGFLKLEPLPQTSWEMNFFPQVCSFQSKLSTASSQTKLK